MVDGPLRFKTKPLNLYLQSQKLPCGYLFASLEPCSMLLHPAQWEGDFVYCITELHYPLAPNWEAPAKKAPVGERELGYLFLRFFFFELLSVGKGTFSNMKLYFGSDNPILQPKATWKSGHHSPTRSFRPGAGLPYSWQLSTQLANILSNGPFMKTLFHLSLVRMTQ